MKAFHLKLIAGISVMLIFGLFFQTAEANNKVPALNGLVFISNNFKGLDTPKTSKNALKAKRVSEKKNREADKDDDIRERYKQEFLRLKDPSLNVVPVERLINARKIRDQLIARKTNTVKASVNTASALSSISTIQWTERGPNNVGGRTRALMFDLNDAANGYKKVFAGAIDGGLWYTTDITATPVKWNKINDLFDNLAFTCIAQDPINPLNIFAGTGEGWNNVDAIQGLGVWASGDGGVTWARLTSTALFKFVNSILVDDNENVFIAGNGYGIQKSTDLGTTWNQVIPSPGNGADLQLAANGDIYASTGVFSTGNIFISDFTVNGINTGNAGTWTNITPETTGVITPSTTSWARIKLACAPNNAGIVYAFLQGASSLNVTSVQQYNRATNAWSVKTVPAGSSFSNGQAWYSIALVVDPNNANTLYAGSLDAVRSSNGGTTWSPVTEWVVPESPPIAGLTAAQYVHADHHAYVFAPGSSSRLLIGSDGGISYTANANASGGTLPAFVSKNNSYDVTQFYSVALHPTNTNYALAGAQDNGTQKFTAAGINTTTEVTGGDGGFSFIDQLNPNIQITSFPNSNYAISTDNGVTFNDATTDTTGTFINPSDYDANQENLYGASVPGSYFRWTDVTNTSVYGHVAVPGFAGATVTSVTVAPITSNRVYFGLDNGEIAIVNNANTGTSNPSVILNPNSSVAATVSCVAIDPATENHILVSYSNYGVVHLFETKNASAGTPVWTSINGNLPDMPVRWVILYPGDATRAIIATELGVWTTDALNGVSTVWAPSNSGLANVEVDMLKFRASDRTLAAATHGRGLFTTILPSFSSIATLSALTISSGTLTPVFATGTTSYTASVLYAASTITVTPTTSVGTATIKVNGTTVASGAASGPIALSVGANTITTVVTNGASTKTYTVTVTRAAASNNAYLATINLTPAASLTVVSGPDYKDYTASEPNTTSSVTVTFTTHDPTATVKVNGTTVASGTPSGAIALSVGPNAITIVSTAQDGTTTKTYGITVTRVSSSPASLSALQLSSGTLTPVFATATTSYTASVLYAASTITVTPTTSVGTATIKVNGTTVASGAASGPIALSVGSNTITTVVTNGASTKTYTVTVTRAAASNNAYLATINLTPAASLTVVSGPDYKDYTASVPNTTSSVTVTFTTHDPTATVKVNGTTVASGTPSGAIALSVGPNTITIVSTAQDGVTAKTYGIAVTRMGPVNIPDATVSVSSPTNSPTLAEEVVVVHAGVSPNGDGINDFLQIDGILAYPDNKLMIMNRNGALVYEAKGYDNSSHVFDGHSNKNGQMQLAGTYFYSLDYTINGIIKHKTGFLVLKY